MKIIKVDSETLLKYALNIRDKVFTKEKLVPKNIEVDAYDKLCGNCDHFLIEYDLTKVGALRCLKVEDKTVILQRLCFLKDYRGLGLGRKVLQYIEKYYKTYGMRRITADAKYDALTFYEKCGYKKVSDVFVEAGVEHIKIMKNL